MTQTGEFKAVIGKGNLMMRHGGWRWTLPATELPRILKLYTGLRDRLNGKYAKFYEKQVQVLEGLQRSVAEK